MVAGGDEVWSWLGLKRDGMIKRTVIHSSLLPDEIQFKRFSLPAKVYPLTIAKLYTGSILLLKSKLLTVSNLSSLVVN